MFLRDLTLVLRQLRRAPGYAIAVTLTLALAIGANTAAFSLVDALLIRRLPYPEPERIGAVLTHEQGTDPTTGVAGVEDDNALDLTEWRAVRDNTPAVITATSAEGAGGVNAVLDGSARYLLASRVSARYFDVLGIKPLLGRGFTEQEDSPGGPEAAVLSYSLWQSSFRGDAAVLGRAALIKGEPYTIVGILPPGVQTPGGAQLWLPHRADDPKGECAGGDNCHVLVRLRPGASWEEARAQLRRIHTPRFDRLATKYHGAGWFEVRSLREDLAAGDEGGASLAGQAKGLMLAVLSVLLIAAANLAGLALVRVTRRTPALATRMALGASRGELLWQLWLESLVLALAGAGLAIGLAQVILDAATRYLPEWMIPLGGLHLAWHVLLFGLAIAVGTSLLFGLLPALQLRRVEVASVMVGAGRRVVGARNGLRQWLIGAEVALAVVLLAAAGLLVRTLIHLQTLPPGFDPQNVMTAKASLDNARYHDAARFQSLLVNSVAAMRAIPGVEDAAVGSSLPYERGLNNGFKIDDGPRAGSKSGASCSWVTPGYFATLRIPLLAGRLFTDSDTATSEKVAVVNASFGRRFFGDPNPIGRHFDGYAIVGVVADVAKSPGMEAGAPLSTEPVYYLPAQQTPQSLINMANLWFQPSWIVRTHGQIGGLTGQMQRALSSVDSGLPFSGFYSMKELQAQQLALQRVEVAVLTALSGLALLLAAIGVYSLVANIVVERTREIGIRMALGSTVAETMLTIGKSGAVAGAAGTVAGVVLSLFVLRILKNQVFGVQPLDPMTLTVVPAMLLILCAVASTLPALRISQIDPAEVLRQE